VTIINAYNMLLLFYHNDIDCQQNYSHHYCYYHLFCYLLLVLQNSMSIRISA